MDQIFEELRALAQSDGALPQTALEFVPENQEYCRSDRETRHTVCRLPNVPLDAGEGALRPQIMIGTAVWPLRRPAIDLSVSSFVSEALGHAIGALLQKP